ncbi:MAG: hypothetical protein JO010_02495 [Alphaproteobacteria bacterium]|nr:hypothetical protein [Alphaproteobacteria bacterium]
MKHGATLLLGLCILGGISLASAQAADDTIHVLRANSGGKNVIADVKKVCEGNATCLLPAGKGTLKMSWSCGGKPASGSFPEGGLASISCKPAP